MRRFLGYGLTIASDFDLLLPESYSDDAPAITVRDAPTGFFAEFREKEDRSAPPQMCRYEPLSDGSSFISWYSLCDFFIAPDGRTIFCGPRSSFCEAHVGFLLSFVLSFSLIRLGDEVLHATVVEMGGQAVGFLGNSGAGKSTLASYCLTRGARLVSDDMLRVMFEGHSVIAHPGPHRLKLFPESAALLQQGIQTTTQMNPFTNKQLVAPPATQRQNRGVALGALYLLEAQGVSENRPLVKKEKLKSSQALLSILGSTFNGAVRSSERLKQQLSIAQKVVSFTPIFRLSYPRRFEVLSEVFETIELGSG